MNITTASIKQSELIRNNIQENLQVNVPKIIVQLDNKNTQKYRIIYAFDVETVVFLAKKYVTAEINEDQAFAICHKELALLFPTALKERYYLEKYRSYCYEWSITYDTELEFQVAKIRLKQQFREKKLTPFADLDDLDIKTFNQDYRSTNYWLFKTYKKLLKIKNFPNIHKSFYYRKIISLADGKRASEGTASVLAQNLIKCNDNISITAANIYSECKNYSPMIFNNIKVEVIDLDNCKSFLQQGITAKFDLVVMRKSLCFCYITPTEQVACGGVMLRKYGNLKKLLFNIAEIIDIDNPKSIAILTGENIFQMSFWQDEIKEFNTENNNNLIAEIARDKIGHFKGILIFNRALAM
jgi:hypothetical protein